MPKRKPNRGDGEPAGKPPRHSRTGMTELVLPNDANTHGNVLGGRVMHWIDLAGAITAYRHCRLPVVTASVDSLIFLHPIKVGELVLLEAIVNRSFRSSMEVQVEVWAEEPLTGKKRRTSTAFLTFVALDQKGRPARVPPLEPETPQERRRFRQALQRRRQRLAAKQDSL